jgi:hypothetical protein
VQAIKFRGADYDGLKRLGDPDWNKVLLLGDRMHLTLPLFRIWKSELPDWVESRMARNLADNSERFAQIKIIYSEIAERLHHAGLNHLVLKGFAQCPSLTDDARYRMQSDLDLYAPPKSIFQVRDALSTLGYQPQLGLHPPGAEHLPPMMRSTEWAWNGNMYDPKMPLAIELHFRFWNETTTGLDLNGLDQFWSRRTTHQIEDFRFPSLSEVDGVAYSAMHVFHHLQIGGLVPSHVYELAYFLHHNAGNSTFWKQWRESQHASLRKIQAACFRLASEWFGCYLPNEVKREISLLPPGVEQWFGQFAYSPLNSVVRANKDPLWLHLCLVSSWKNKVSVIRHALFPKRTLSLGSAQLRSKNKAIGFVVHIVSKIMYHLWILSPTLWHGIRWWWATKRPSRRYAASR